MLGEFQHKYPCLEQRDVREAKFLISGVNLYAPKKVSHHFKVYLEIWAGSPAGIQQITTLLWFPQPHFFSFPWDSSWSQFLSLSIWGKSYFPNTSMLVCKSKKCTPIPIIKTMQSFTSQAIKARPKFYGANVTLFVISTNNVRNFSSMGETQRKYLVVDAYLPTISQVHHTNAQTKPLYTKFIFFSFLNSE